MERISTHQFMILSSSVLLGTTFFPAPELVTGIAGRNGWMAILPGFLLGIPFGLMVLSMIPKYPNKNFLEISEKVLGKWFGKGLGLLYILITSYFGAVLSGQGFDMITRTILPLMPQSVFMLFGTLLILLLFYYGIEVFGRFSEVIFPIVTVSMLFIVVLIIPRFEQGELFPILADGIKPVIKASVEIAPWPMEYILFLAGLLPFLSRKSSDLKQMRTGIWRAILLVAFLDTVITLIQIQTFGPFETARLDYGLIVLGKMIEVSGTVTGIESIFTLIWMGTFLIKVGAFFYTGMWGLKSVFGIKSKKVGILLLGFAHGFIQLFFLRGAQIIVEIQTIDDYLILPFSVSWVLLVWGVDKWKGRLKSL